MTRFALLLIMLLVLPGSTHAAQFMVRDYDGSCPVSACPQGWVGLSYYDTSEAYLMAREVLSPATGLTTLADEALMAGPLRIFLEGQLLPNSSLMLMTEPDAGGAPFAQFLSAGDASRYVLYIPTPNIDVGRYEQSPFLFYNMGAAPAGQECNASAGAILLHIGNTATTNPPIRLRDNLVAYLAPTPGVVYPGSMRHYIMARSSANISQSPSVAFDVREHFVAGASTVAHGWNDMNLNAAYDVGEEVLATHFRVGAAGPCRAIAQWFSAAGLPGGTTYELLQVSSSADTFERTSAFGPKPDMVDAEGPTFHVRPGVGCTEQGQMRLGVSTSGEGSDWYAYATFAKEFSPLIFNALQAELNDRRDYMEFVPNPSRNVTATTIGPNTLLGFSQAPATGFIAYAQSPNNTLVDMTLQSSSVLPITSLRLNGIAGARGADLKTYSFPDVPIQFGAIGVYLSVSGTEPISPSQWTLSVGQCEAGAVEGFCFLAPANPPPATRPEIEVTDSRLPANDLSSDMGTLMAGLWAEALVYVRNTGAANLVIGQIAQTDALGAPFTIQSDQCSGQSLPPLAICTIMVRYSPASAGVHVDTFSIPSNDVDEATVTFTLRGSATAPPAPPPDGGGGGEPAPVPDMRIEGLAQSGVVAFDDLLVAQVSQRTITVRNTGQAALEIYAIAHLDALAAPFGIAQDGCSGASLAPGGSCMVTITFAPTGPGNFTDRFDVISNDPDALSVVVTVAGTGIVEHVPAPPVQLIYPPDGHTGLSTRVTLRWSAYEGAHGYRLYVSERSDLRDAAPIDVQANPSNAAAMVMGAGLLGLAFVGQASRGRKWAILVILIIVLALTMIAACSGGDSDVPQGQVSQQVGGLRPGMTYYWSVQAVAADGHEIAHGPIWQFHTAGQ